MHQTRQQPAWRSLEALESECEPESLWLQRLGDDSPLFRYLRATGLRRQTVTINGERLHVVQGASNENPVACTSDGLTQLPLQLSDIDLLRLDRRRLCADICIAFDITPHQHTSLTDDVVTIGTWSYDTRNSLPVLLMLLHSADRAEYCTHRVLALERQAILFAMTDQFLSREHQAMLRGRDCCLMTLERAVHVDSGGLTPVQTLTSAIDLSDITLVGHDVDLSMLQVPAGTGWDRIELKLVDGESFRVSIAGKWRTCTFEQLGMLDQRSGKPTRAWMLLEHLAKNGGSCFSGRDRQPQKDSLCRALRRAFGISELPIVARRVNGKNMWRCHFRISEA